MGGKCGRVRSDRRAGSGDRFRGDPSARGRAPCGIGHVSVHVGGEGSGGAPLRGAVRNALRKNPDQVSHQAGGAAAGSQFGPGGPGAHLSQDHGSGGGTPRTFIGLCAWGGDLLHDVQQAAGRAAPRPGVYQHQLRPLWSPGRARGVSGAHEYGDGRDLHRRRVHGDRGRMPGRLRLSDVRPDQLTVLRERDDKGGSADRSTLEGQRRWRGSPPRPEG